MSQTIDLPISVVGTVAEAADDADIVLACTSAREPYLTPANVRPGTFIAAVGADNPDKSEVAPALMRHARVVTDVTAQCQLMGDLHHALAAGAMTLGDVRAELGDVLSGRAEVRGAKDDIVVFDSTGTAAQDIASAVAVFERAKAAGIGQSVDFLER
jgi:ornithine cyclodeaminase/alanine dehydrogenase-like protein (mu-crystallin family)